MVVVIVLFRFLLLKVSVSVRELFVGLSFSGLGFFEKRRLV